MDTNRTGAASAFTVLLLGGTLALAGKILMDDQQAPATATGLTAQVGLGVAAFGTLILVWWILGFCAAITAELLTRRGRLRAGRRIGAFAPTYMRQTACLALGLNLVALPAAHADTGFTTNSSAGEQIYAAEDASPLTPQWAPIEAPQVLKPFWRPTAPPPGASLLVKDTRDSRLAPEPPTRVEVVVQPGDSLWTIAARHLGPNASDAIIAEAWPQWYVANQGLIGEHPDLLKPGQILHPPAATPTVSK